MSHLYLFSAGEERVFVAASSWKAARNILRQIPKYKKLRLPEIAGKRIAVNCTAEQGIISIHNVFLKYAWWTCKCGNASFIPLDNGHGCRCTECGRERRLGIW